ncbi:MAG: 4-hydroxythreonine-4-phosphate dehydrogenase PdxA [Chitinivibrionales bacterium]|nr:4-hydroxythreonine-4-phosphate dehydrogenase PdxA [Chitinivibrionales bacterium]
MAIGVTLGDASGVGPEILVRAYLAGTLPPGTVVIGDRSVVDYCVDTLGVQATVRSASTLTDIDTTALNVFDMGILSREDIRPGELSRASGGAALSYLERAVQAALNSEIEAIVTLPMNKEATRLSAPDFTGHTDVIAQACGIDSYTLSLISDTLVVAHVSAHVSLREAIERVETRRVLEVIRLAGDACRRLGRGGRIAVMGLNPHAGEGGAFGDEEIRLIRPAVEQAREEGMNVTGPLPPDTVFMRATKGAFDAVVCMYHDQGHIGMKTLGLDTTVNVTLGLPIVRTSVDHGTAFDIAYRGVASTGSFDRACALALTLARNK